MADYTEKKLPRDRKPNFSSLESNLISSRVVEELEILRARHSGDVSQSKKNEIWKKITGEVNALGFCFRNEAEIRNKYRNLCRGAKDKFTLQRKESSATGGGPPPTQLSSAEENIINVMKDTASFSGVVGGLESNIIPNDSTNIQPDENENILTNQPPTRPTAQEATWIRALDRHHENLTQEGDAVAEIQAVFQEGSSCGNTSKNSAQPPPKKRKTATAEDVYVLQCEVLQKELIKNDLQIELLKKINKRYDREEESDALELLSVLTR